MALKRDFWLNLPQLCLSKIRGRWSIPMSKSKAAVFVGITICFLFITGALIFVKNRFRPTVVRTWVLQAVNEALPGAEVTIVNLQLNFGINIYVHLADVSLRTKEKNIELFDVHSCIMKLPLWAILTGQGAVEVLVDKPQAYYVGSSEANNWMVALHQPPQSKLGDSSVVAITSAREGVKVGDKPQFKFISKILKRLSVNIKMGDLHIVYSLPNNQSGKFHIEKFIVKGLNLESNTAFELASNVSVGLGNQGKTQFDLLAIGQFNLAEILFNSVLNTKAIAHLKNFNLPQGTVQIPEIKAEIDLVLDKNNNMHGPILVNFGGSAMSANIKGTLENPTFESLTIDLLVDDLTNMMMLKHDQFTFGSSRIHVDGKLNIQNEKFFPRLKFGLSTPIIYKNESLQASLSLAGMFQDGEYDLTSRVETLAGNITANLKGMLDVNHLPNKAEKYRPFILTVVANKLLLTKETFRKLLYKESEEIDKSDLVIQEQKETLKFPPGEIFVSLREIMTGVTPLNMEARISVKSESLEVTHAVVKYTGDDKAALILRANISSGSNQKISGKLRADFQTFNVQGLYPFFPKFIDGISGVINGKINAKFSTGRKWAYNIATDITAKNGEVRGLNLKEKIFPILKKWEEAKGKTTNKLSDLADLDQHFDSLELKGDLTDSEYKINKFNFSGGPKRVSVKSNGIMYDQHVTKDGEFFLVLSDVKLKKHYDISALPMRFFGRGLWPTLDYDYTLEKLGMQDRFHDPFGTHRSRKAAP